MTNILTRGTGVAVLGLIVWMAHYAKSGGWIAPSLLIYGLMFLGAFLVGRGIRSHGVAGAVMFLSLVIASLGVRYI